MISFFKSLVDKILAAYQWLLSQLFRFKYSKVNRKQYIASIVKKLFPEDDGTILDKALSGSLTDVLTEKQHKKIYSRMMWRYGLIVFTVSFILTLTPDILWVTALAGILDLAIFQIVLFVAMQKIMMLLGQEVDLHSDKEEGVSRLMSIDSSGVMFGKHPILQKMKSAAGWLSRQIVQKVGPRLLAKLSRPISIVLRRQGLKWLSVILTKENLDIALAAVVPITCAFISGLVSVVIFVPMCNKLRKHLLEASSHEVSSLEVSSLEDSSGDDDAPAENNIIDVEISPAETIADAEISSAKTIADAEISSAKSAVIQDEYVAI